MSSYPILDRSHPLMSPRPAKSLATARVRYVVQWTWFPVLWAVWLIPYLILVVLYYTVLWPFMFVWEVEMPAPYGSARQFRWRRRMWLNRNRLRRECSTDLPWLEDELRALFDNRKPILLGWQSSGTVWRHRDGRVEIDDSYFRQLGAARALQIAAEYDCVPTDGARDLPTWLVLRRAPGSPPNSLTSTP